MLVDRTTAKFKVHFHVFGDRRAGRERLDVFRLRVDLPCELTYVSPVPQSLNAARGRTRADGDEVLAPLTHRADAFRVVRRGDRAFHEPDVIDPGRVPRPGFKEVRDLDPLGD